MNSSSLNDLIDSIRSLLDGRPSSIAAEVVALEYARHCREVNERLGRIAPMLDGGGEIQALQLAEQPPRVLDLAVSLSFGGEGEWQDYCRGHGHEVAPLIDARTLEALLGIQEKGVSSNHPLYKDYRAAVSSRDDGKAYELIRIITRLNPGDENAVREIKRLERKSVQAALVELRTALAAKNDEEVLAIMPRVEQSGEPEIYEKLPEWQEAHALRQRQRREDAKRRMPELLLKAEEEMKAGDWRQAAVSHGEYSLLLETHGADGEELGMSGRAKTLAEQLAKHRSEAERVGQVKQLTAEMSRIADEVEIRAVTPFGITPDFARPLLENLARHWRQVEELRGEVPTGSRARIDATRARLAQAIERDRSSRRMKIVAGTVAGATLLLAGIGFGLVAFRASAHAKMLGELQAKESASAVRDLLDRVKGKEALLLRFPTLSAAAVDANRWLDTATNNSKLVEKEISRLESAREVGFDGLPSPELHERLEDAGKWVSKLPVDLKHAAETRLAIVRNEADKVLQKRQETANSKALLAIVHWAQILDGVDYKESVSRTTEATGDSEAALGPFLDLAIHKVPLLRLPATTESAIQDLDSRFAKVREQAGAVQNALVALESSENPQAYRAALESLARCNFKEGQTAQLALDGLPEDERLKAFLVFRGDLAALKSAENEPSPNLPMPEAATKLDRDVISELMKSETLNGLWVVEWKGANGTTQNCLGKGELERHGLKSWSGKVATYPKHSSTALKFVDTQFSDANGITVTSNRIIPASAMMARLQLPLLLDDTGTEYRSTILPLVDRVTNAKDASPLARAHVLEKLFKLIHGREHAWGIHYCPELINDIEAFSEIQAKWPVFENSWLLQEKPNYSKPWEEYFAARENSSLFDDLKKMKSAASYGIKNPFVLAGRVDQSGAVKLQQSETPRLLVGVGEVKAGVPGPRVVGIAKAGTPFMPSSPLVPLSPILCIEMPEADQQFLQSIHLPDSSLVPTTRNP